MLSINGKSSYTHAHKGVGHADVVEHSVALGDMVGFDSQECAVV